MTSSPPSSNLAQNFPEAPNGGASADSQAQSLWMRLVDSVAERRWVAAAETLPGLSAGFDGPLADALQRQMRKTPLLAALAFFQGIKRSFATKEGKGQREQEERAKKGAAEMAAFERVAAYLENRSETRDWAQKLFFEDRWQIDPWTAPEHLAFQARILGDLANKDALRKMLQGAMEAAYGWGEETGSFDFFNRLGIASHFSRLQKADNLAHWMGDAEDWSREEPEEDAAAKAQALIRNSLRRLRAREWICEEDLPDALERLLNEIKTIARRQPPGATGAMVAVALLEEMGELGHGRCEWPSWRRKIDALQKDVSEHNAPPTVLSAWSHLKLVFRAIDEREGLWRELRDEGNAAGEEPRPTGAESQSAAPLRL